MAESEISLSAVILGSFQFKEAIDAAAEVFREELKVNVLAPRAGSVISVIERVKVLEGDNPQDGTVALETTFVREFPNAHFLYIVARGGYIGISTATEAYINTMIYGKPMFSSELITKPDPRIQKPIMDVIYRQVMPSDLKSAVNYVRHGLNCGYQLDRPIVQEKAMGLVLLSDPQLAASIVVNAEKRENQGAS